MEQHFSRVEKESLIPLLQTYLKEELTVELGPFDTEFLLDFIAENLGPLLYNRALQDVQTHLSLYFDSLNERIDELQKPLPPNMIR
jgi:uncharacterized protein (DUF2164 family)